jgi:hypothetical protein
MPEAAAAPSGSNSQCANLWYSLAAITGLEAAATMAGECFKYSSIRETWSEWHDALITNGWVALAQAWPNNATTCCTRCDC